MSDNDLSLHNYHMKSAIYRFIGVLILLSSAFTDPGQAATLRERITPGVLAIVMPGAERLGAEDGSPPAIPVYDKDGEIAAYLFSTLDVVDASGYSGVPFDVIAGVDLRGRITGAKVVSHAEPLVLNDPIRQPQLDTFLARQAGVSIRGGTVSDLTPDFVGGASVSARAMRGAVAEAARLVLRARAPLSRVSYPALDREQYQRVSWDRLLKEHAVAHSRFAAVGTDLFAALFSPPAIGANLVGLNRYNEYIRRFPPDASLIAVASNGPYDFLGDDYVRAEKEYRFDRLRVRQGGRIFNFSSANAEFLRLDTRASEGFLSQDYAAIFMLPPAFDPLDYWQLELLVHEPGREVAYLLPYRLPASYVAMPETSSGAVWVETWRDARGNIAILGGALIVLTLIFVFQDRLARSRLTHRLVRMSFLAFVLVWFGWIAGAQLSILHLTTWLRALVSGADAGAYLMEPLISILALYTLVSLLLIGRGVFCGWLCPFGALQELLAQAARAIGVPQWQPSSRIVGLRVCKYVAAALLMGLVVVSVRATNTVAEIEPFKTAITAKFTRTWPYVAYAGGILAIGLFTERVFCRFFCPLGGVLAALDRFHLLDRLRRRAECGSPCHLCEVACPVGAIEKSGRIVTAECFQCLDCQVVYFDDHRCPPLVAARRLRKRNALRA